MLVDKKEQALSRLYGKSGAIEKIYLMRKDNPHVLSRFFYYRGSYSWGICPTPYYWPNLLPVGDFRIRIPETATNEDLDIFISTKVRYDGTPHVLVAFYREGNVLNYVYINDKRVLTTVKRGRRDLFCLGIR